MKYVTIIILSVLLISASIAEPDKSLAKVDKKQGRLIFTHCKPVAEYDVLFTIKMPSVIWSDRQRNTIAKIEDWIIKKANTQSMKIGLSYDAIIINEWDDSIAIKFKE